MLADGFSPLADAAERALRIAGALGLAGEVRAERHVERTLATYDGVLGRATTLLSAGVGVRVVRGARQGYASTTDLSPRAVRAAVADAARMAGARSRRDGGGAGLTRARGVAGPTAGRGSAPPYEASEDADDPDDPDLEAKLDLLQRASRAGRDAGKEVATVVASHRERRSERLVLRTDGARASWAPGVATLDVVVVSRSPHGLARGRAFHGGSVGLGAFAGEHSPEAMGTRAAQWAAERIDARRPPAMRCPAVIDPLLAGVLAHESFGHLAEADGVESGWSMLAGRLGERLGSRHATIRDGGTPPEGAVGGIALPFDDEATPAREVTVLDRGVLRGWLHDRGTAARMAPREGGAGGGSASTGNARALDHRFPPIPRMRNTWFAPGDLTLEEALEEARDGIYACGTTGGEARSDGQFMFTVVRAYRVDKGEVAEPLRDVAITGNVLRFLRAVRGATRDLALTGGAHVSCGKFGQWPLPVAYGGPHLLLREALFGGEGTAWAAAQNPAGGDAA